MMNGRWHGIAMWTSGFIIGVFLMVGDELISLSLYCGEKCYYPYPLIGAFPIWTAWEIAFGSIFAGIIIVVIILSISDSHNSKCN